MTAGVKSLAQEHETVKGSNLGSGVQCVIHLKGHFCNAIHVKLKKQKFVFILF